MIKAIIFDFDGVIIESADIKADAFRELFGEYPEEVERIVRYHLLNEGISRFVKFRYIYKNILRKSLLKNKEVALGKRFSQIVFNKVLAAPFVVGAKEFLDKNNGRYQFFIASGTPEKELNNIIAKRRLRDYFKGIYGSPREKKDIIVSIIKKFSFFKKEVIYIGDAQSDAAVAKKVGIVFIRRVAKVDSDSLEKSVKISNFLSLGEVLKEIES